MNGITSNGVHASTANGILHHPDTGEETLSITMDDFVQAQDGFTPLSLRDVKLEKSSVAWSDIGGLTETAVFFAKPSNGPPIRSHFRLLSTSSSIWSSPLRLSWMR